MKNYYSVIQYLLGASEYNYLEGIIFDKIEPSKIVVTLLVEDEQRINPVKWMIEANMYTDRKLLSKNVQLKENMIAIECFDNMTYNIKIKSKEKHVNIQ